MENEPIFEWSLGNNILDKQEDGEDFDNMINDLQQHHNDDEDSDYIPDNYDGYDNSLG